MLVLPLYVSWFLGLYDSPVGGRGKAGAAADRLTVKITRAAIARLQAAVLSTRCAPVLP